jgi:hypothetical protein
MYQRHACLPIRYGAKCIAQPYGWHGTSLESDALDVCVQSLGRVLRP